MAPMRMHGRANESSLITQMFDRNERYKQASGDDHMLGTAIGGAAIQGRAAAKISRLTNLGGADREAFHHLVRKWRYVAARDDLVEEGDHLGHVSLIISGWAYRYKQLEDGRRQIAGILLPGDLTEALAPEGYAMDCSIAALTPLTCADIPLRALATVCEQHPAVRQALLWESFIAASIQREWLLNVGQRVGTERVGHLLCELFLRLRRAGLTEDNSFVLLLTQFDMANALGLSHVHINRKLAQLRDQGLVEMLGRTVRIPDIAALQAASLFNPNYLHLSDAAARSEVQPRLSAPAAPHRIDHNRLVTHGRRRQAARTPLAGAVHSVADRSAPSAGSRPRVEEAVRFARR